MPFKLPASRPKLTVLSLVASEPAPIAIALFALTVTPIPIATEFFPVIFMREPMAT